MCGNVADDLAIDCNSTLCNELLCLAAAGYVGLCKDLSGEPRGGAGRRGDVCGVPWRCVAAQERFWDCCVVLWERPWLVARIVAAGERCGWLTKHGCCARCVGGNHCRETIAEGTWRIPVYGVRCRRAVDSVTPT